jgi:hypothetical protein
MAWTALQTFDTGRLADAREDFREYRGLVFLEQRGSEVNRSRIKQRRGLSQPQFRLRVNEIRVFYDVVGETVEILAIITKAQAAKWLGEHGRTASPSGAGKSEK